MANELERCCDAMDLSWQVQPVGDKWADIYMCATCGHAHRMESWFIAKHLPGEGQCVNCAGEYSLKTFQVAMLEPGARPPRPEKRCDNCGKSPDEVFGIHRELAALHPDGSAIAAAEVAAEVGRYVLSIKLATAAFVYDKIEDESRALRLQALEAMNLHTEALEEAWSWVDLGAPLFIWGIISELEASAGNVEGALQCIERGLELDPQNHAMWMDYAELLFHIENRPQAIEAASFALNEPSQAARGLIVLAKIAETYYAEGLLIDAMATTNAAGELCFKSAEISWLRARMAATQQQPEETHQWLEVVLQVDPEHAEARQALARLTERDKQTGKKGWFGWNRS